MGGQVPVVGERKIFSQEQDGHFEEGTAQLTRTASHVQASALTCPAEKTGHVSGSWTLTYVSLSSYRVSKKRKGRWKRW